MLPVSLIERHATTFCGEGEHRIARGGFQAERPQLRRKGIQGHVQEDRSFLCLVLAEMRDGGTILTFQGNAGPSVGESRSLGQQQFRLESGGLQVPSLKNTTLAQQVGDTFKVLHGGDGVLLEESTLVEHLHIDAADTRKRSVKMVGVHGTVQDHMEFSFSHIVGRHKDHASRCGGCLLENESRLNFRKVVGSVEFQQFCLVGSSRQGKESIFAHGGQGLNLYVRDFRNNGARRSCRSSRKNVRDQGLRSGNDQVTVLKKDITRLILQQADAFDRMASAHSLDFLGSRKLQRRSKFMEESGVVGGCLGQGSSVALPSSKGKEFAALDGIRKDDEDAKSYSRC
mmetsp:Transcript_13510/g.27560  ORF Transcript_13510/g.27560 Transcript_13510/m.27560 type:complete len:342 (-) Transcript_13510:446-1471(-)